MAEQSMVGRGRDMEAERNSYLERLMLAYEKICADVKDMQQIVYSQQVYISQLRQYIIQLRHERQLPPLPLDLPFSPSSPSLGAAFSPPLFPIRDNTLPLPVHMQQHNTQHNQLPLPSLTSSSSFSSFPPSYSSSASSSFAFHSPFVIDSQRFNGPSSTATRKQTQNDDAFRVPLTSRHHNNNGQLEMTHIYNSIQHDISPNVGYQRIPSVQRLSMNALYDRYQTVAATADPFLSGQSNMYHQRSLSEPVRPPSLPRPSAFHPPLHRSQSSPTRRIASHDTAAADIQAAQQGTKSRMDRFSRIPSEPAGEFSHSTFSESNNRLGAVKQLQTLSPMDTEPLEDETPFLFSADTKNRNRSDESSSEYKQRRVHGGLKIDRRVAHHLESNIMEQESLIYLLLSDCHGKLIAVLSRVFATKSNLNKEEFATAVDQAVNDVAPFCLHADKVLANVKSSCTSAASSALADIFALVGRAISQETTPVLQKLDSMTSAMAELLGSKPLTLSNLVPLLSSPTLAVADNRRAQVASMLRTDEGLWQGLAPVINPARSSNPLQALQLRWIASKIMALSPPEGTNTQAWEQSVQTAFALSLLQSAALANAIKGSAAWQAEAADATELPVGRFAFAARKILDLVVPSVAARVAADLERDLLQSGKTTSFSAADSVFGRLIQLKDAAYTSLASTALPKAVTPLVVEAPAPAADKKPNKNAQDKGKAEAKAPSTDKKDKAPKNASNESSSGSSQTSSSSDMSKEVQGFVSAKLSGRMPVSYFLYAVRAYGVQQQSSAVPPVKSEAAVKPAQKASSCPHAPSSKKSARNSDICSVFMVGSTDLPPGHTRFTWGLSDTTSELPPGHTRATWNPSTLAVAASFAGTSASAAGKPLEKKSNKDAVKGEAKPAQQKPEKKTTGKVTCGASTTPAAAGAAATGTSADVGKLDLRVGCIVKAWKHPDADSLYVEEVDCGDSGSHRQVVSGLVKYIPLEQMQNRMVVVLCNLKPSKLRGQDSQAMVMAANNEDGSVVELVTPPAGAKPGDLISFEGLDCTPETNVKAVAKIWETVAPHLKTDGAKIATCDGRAFLTSNGPCTVASLVNAKIK
eukprot:GILK01003226.1.p1 GENE.GILK01003226.1~~GILK01003226.1.p1  ORF type:complete len:1089 (-),score=195.65 GILK01003226.1:79-3345(-)